MGHVWSKTRSLGQILEKPCARSGCHIFSPITMKLCQNVGLAEISDSFENESCRAKIQVNRSNFGKKKKLVYALEVTFSVQQS